MRTTQELAAQQHTSDFSSLGRSLRRAARAAGVSALGVAMGIAAGCSPQEKSYWAGSFTKLPDPPANARMQLSTSTEQDGTVFINYIVWDASTNQFARKDIHYSTTFSGPGTFSECGGYSQKIRDGEVLYGGAIVDQANGKIILPDGKVIEGATGNVKQGAEVVKTLGS